MARFGAPLAVRCAPLGPLAARFVAAIELLSALVIVPVTLGCEEAELLARVRSATSRPGSTRDASPLPNRPEAGPPVAPARPDASSVDAGAPPLDGGADEFTPVTAINDPVERDTDPSFTEDLLELYFMSTRGGSKDLWRSLRADPSEPWGPPELVSELSAPGQEENPTVSDDGLALWFFTDRDRALGSIWHTTRASRQDPWGEPSPIAGLTLGEGSSAVSVAVDDDATLFVLSAKPPGGQPYGLYQFTLDETGTLSAAVPLAEVNSTDDDFDPNLRDDGLFLAFDSDRLGVRQIFWARRPTLAEPFAEPVPLSAGPVFDESAVSFSTDLRYLMFSSARDGQADIYERTLPAPL